MLIEHIEYLRKQPVHVRRKYVLIYSVFLTSVVVVVWLSVLFGGRIQNTEPAPVNTMESNEEQINRTDFFESANTFFDILNKPKSVQEGVEAIQPGGSAIVNQNIATTSSSTELVDEGIILTTPQTVSTTSTTSDEDAVFVETILEDLSQ